MRKNNAMNQEEEENEINLTPMLDVVFIMLIFFIVTASFIKESGIDVNRPDAPTSERVEDANILVAISPNDEIYQILKILKSIPRVSRANFYTPSEPPWPPGPWGAIFRPFGMLISFFHVGASD